MSDLLAKCCKISTKSKKYGSNSKRAQDFFLFILLLWKPASSNCINANNFPSFKAAEVRDQILASAFQAMSQTSSDSLKATRAGGGGGQTEGLINFSYRTISKMSPYCKGCHRGEPCTACYSLGLKKCAGEIQQTPSNHKVIYSCRSPLLT